MSDDKVEECNNLEDFKETVRVTVSTEKMIALIKNRPCLWNKNESSYRDKSTRDEAWAQVYRILYPPYDDLNDYMRIKVGQQISKKWFNVRDAYVKSKRDGNINRKPYIYSRKLSFIDPFVQTDKCSTNESAVYLEEQTIDDESEHWLNEATFVDIDDPPVKRSKIEHLSTVKDIIGDNDNVVSVFARLIDKEEDEDRAFFTSITPAVKTLSSDSKLEFKIQVMKILKELKKKEADNLYIKTINSDSE